VAFRDVVNVVTGLCLAPHFANLAPEYPKFSVLITETNRRPAVQSALRALAGGPRARDATATLDALEALDGDRIDPSKSRYAKSLLARLAAKGDGQVLNRSELFTGALGVEYYDDGKTRLEPDWVLLVAACLVHSGDIVLAVAGDKVDSSRLTLLTPRARATTWCRSNISSGPNSSMSTCCGRCSSFSACRPAMCRA
jgi:hypothetical protein